MSTALLKNPKVFIVIFFALLMALLILVMLQLPHSDLASGSWSHLASVGWNGKCCG